METSDGNPLFVGEMLQMLLDDGYISSADGAWHLAKPLRKTDIPPSIEALLGARLDRLREQEREIAQRASVAGKVFSRGGVAELSPPSIRPQLGLYLDGLVAKELVEPDTDISDEEAFRFHHILFRDAAYRSMLKERRAELHQRYADWLQARSDGGQAGDEGLIGFHLEQAFRLLSELGPLDDRGIQLGFRASAELADAAKRAAVRGDMPAVVNLAERALELSPHRTSGALICSSWFSTPGFRGGRKLQRKRWTEPRRSRKATSFARHTSPSSARACGS